MIPGVCIHYKRWPLLSHLASLSTPGCRERWPRLLPLRGQRVVRLALRLTQSGRHGGIYHGSVFDPYSMPTALRVNWLPSYLPGA
jgi:hypothetical protein